MTEKKNTIRQESYKFWILLVTLILVLILLLFASMAFGNQIHKLSIAKQEMQDLDKTVKALKARVEGLEKSDENPLPKVVAMDLQSTSDEVVAKEPEPIKKSSIEKKRADYSVYAITGEQAWVMARNEDKPISVLIGHQLPDGSRVQSIDYLSKSISTDKGTIY